MQALLKKTQTGEFEDNGWIFLQSVHWLNDDIDLVFELDDGVEGKPKSSWIIKAKSVHEYRLFEAYDCGLNHYKDNHVIIAQYTDKTANLFFYGRHASAEAVAGALLEAHIDCVQDWIDFDKYINTEQKLSSLISAGFGKLANGPKFLLKEYQSVLARFGIRANIADEMPAKRWDGTAWVEFSNIPEMIHFGGSYVVADAFCASEQRNTE